MTNKTVEKLWSSLYGGKLLGKWHVHFFVSFFFAYVIDCSESKEKPSKLFE